MNQQAKSQIKFGSLAESVFRHKYAATPTETWEECCARVTRSVFAAEPQITPEVVSRLQKAMEERKFLPGGRYLYAAGRAWHQTQNCLLLRAGDSSEGWADLMHKATAALMSGAGIGVDYSALRSRGAPIIRKGGFSTGPCALMQMVNESGRHIMQGGSRRSAIWAGLNWAHADIFEFIRLKDWSPLVKQGKEADFNFPAPMDGTNISVILTKDFFEAYEDFEDPLHDWACSVYDLTVLKMVSTGEPGFSVDYINKNESLRNACCEVISEDDSDICNLGSINLARISNRNEFQQLVQDATAFLLAGTIYSNVPYAKVADIRNKNRRLGLGLMGISEFLLVNGMKMNEEGQQYLRPWLEDYENFSNDAARNYSDLLGLEIPKAVRAIAPTGTLAIIAETTSGIEPIFCKAYKRRYLKNNTWHYQYVIDPTAKRLMGMGIAADKVEDATELSNNPEQRLAFQAFVQGYVDNAISSTLNLPPWSHESRLVGTMSVQDFSSILYMYLPSLRGITCYPDGARSGQPLVPVDLAYALQHEGAERVEEFGDVCDLRKGGSCGS